MCHLCLCIDILCTVGLKVPTSILFVTLINNGNAKKKKKKNEIILNRNKWFFIWIQPSRYFFPVIPQTQLLAISLCKSSADSQKVVYAKWSQLMPFGLMDNNCYTMLFQFFTSIFLQQLWQQQRKKRKMAGQLSRYDTSWSNSQDSYSVSTHKTIYPETL